MKHSIKKTHSMKSICFIIFITLILSQTVFLSGCESVKSGEPLDTRTLAALNKPATIFILTTWTADLKLKDFTFDKKMDENIVDEVLDMVRSGQIADTIASRWAAYLRIRARDMEKYVVYTGKTLTEQRSVQGSGSGFIVTPEGHLVTNAHVVKQDEQTLSQNFVLYGMTDLVNLVVTNIDKQLREEGYTMSQSEKDTMTLAYANVLVKNLTVANLKAKYECILGNVPSDSNINDKMTKLELLTVGEPYPGKDVAILKISGQTNLPTVVLGDDVAIQQGDSVYAMGYPGITIKQGHLNALEEPTLTSGIISAKKQMEEGWDIFQMDASIHSGNSGGPLFNSLGEVVGINTAKSVNEDGSEVSGINYAIPVAIAKQYLDKINITPSESPFTSNYKQALSAYNKGSYKKAATLLQEINNANPGFPTVQLLLTEAQTKAAANPGLPPMVFIIGGAVLFLIIVVVIIIIIIVKRRKKKNANRINPNQNMYKNTASNTNMPSDTNLNVLVPGQYGHPSAPGSGQPSTSAGYGQPSTPAGYGQPPTSAGYGQPPMSAGSGQPPMSAGYGQPPTSPGYGQPPMSAGYGQPPTSPGYGQPPMSEGYGQPPTSPGYGQPPMSAGYGQPPMSAGYGQPPTSAGYGQPPTSAGYGQPPIKSGQILAESGHPPAGPGSIFTRYGQPAKEQASSPGNQPMVGMTTSSPCSQCGMILPSKVQFCTRCGARASSAPIDPDRTIALNSKPPDFIS